MAAETIAAALGASMLLQSGGSKSPSVVKIDPTSKGFAAEMAKQQTAGQGKIPQKATGSPDASPTSGKAAPVAGATVGGKTLPSSVPTDAKTGTQEKSISASGKAPQNKTQKKTTGDTTAPSVATLLTVAAIPVPLLPPDLVSPRGATRQAGSFPQQSSSKSGTAQVETVVTSATSGLNAQSRSTVLTLQHEDNANRPSARWTGRSSTAATQSANQDGPFAMLANTDAHTASVASAQPGGFANLALQLPGSLLKNVSDSNSGQIISTPPVVFAGITATASPVAPVAGVAPPVGANPQWGEALGQQVQFLVGQGIQQATLQLNPPHLGPLEVHLDIQANGQANAYFTSPHPEVLQAITTAIPQLQQSFAAAGMSLGQTSVSADSGGRSFARNRSAAPASTVKAVTESSGATPAVGLLRVQLGLVNTFA